MCKRKLFTYRNIILTLIFIIIVIIYISKKKLIESWNILVIIHHGLTMFIVSNNYNIIQFFLILLILYTFAIVHLLNKLNCNITLNIILLYIIIRTYRRRIIFNGVLWDPGRRQTTRKRIRQNRSWPRLTPVLPTSTAQVWRTWVCTPTVVATWISSVSWSPLL